MDGEQPDRTQRLTPQEWRVIALSIEGVSPTVACESLGIAAGTLESHKQAIRRKLSIPKGERFETYVREHFSGGVTVPAPQKREPEHATEKPSDRRVRWLLRISLDELAELSTSVGLRAQLLKQTVARMGTDDVGEAELEVADLRDLATDLQALFDETLKRIRGRSSPSSG